MNTQTKTVSAANPIVSQAIELAHIANEHPGIGDELATAVRAKEVSGQVPRKLVFLLKEAYGERIHEFPVPGSTEKDVEGTNRPYDLYSESITREGKSREVKGSFYKTFARSLDVLNMPEEEGGMSILARLEYLSTEEAKEEFPAEHERVDEKNKLQGRVNVITNATKTAFHVFHMIEAVNKIPGVKADFAKRWDAKQKKDVYSETSVNIHVYDVERPNQYLMLSVPSFLSLEPEKALQPERLAKHGTEFLSLKSTRSRGTGKSDDNTKEAPKLTINTIESMAADFANFVDSTQGYDKLVKRLKDKDTDDFVLSIGKLYEALEGFMPKIEDRYKALVRLENEKAINKAA